MIFNDGSEYVEFGVLVFGVFAVGEWGFYFHSSSLFWLMPFGRQLLRMASFTE